MMLLWHPDRTVKDLNALMFVTEDIIPFLSSLHFSISYRFFFLRFFPMFNKVTKGRMKGTSQLITGLVFETSNEPEI